jgi:hypothetical protein
MLLSSPYTAQFASLNQAWHPLGAALHHSLPAAGFRFLAHKVIYVRENSRTKIAGEGPWEPYTNLHFIHFFELASDRELNSVPPFNAEQPVTPYFAAYRLDIDVVAILAGTAWSAALAQKCERF